MFRREKEVVYNSLRRLANIAGYNLIITQKSDAPYKTNLQDGLLCQHNTEFLLNERFIKACERGMKALPSEYDFKSHWRIHVALWAAYNCSGIEGDYVECGVGNGIFSSAIMEYLNWNELDKEFYLFDTFTGLARKYLTSKELERIGDVESYNEGKRKRGIYNRDYQQVEENFREWNRVHLIKGAIPETLNTIHINHVAYLHIDMNCVIPEIAAIDHFYPKLSTGAIILLDDYAFSGHDEQKKGMDKWADKVGVKILSLPTGQGMLVKTELSTMTASARNNLNL
jgi:hypothetical protein